ncbi:MAG: LegC family aminotransferase [Pontiellaceae bacterium]|nr:LegC family aminotransferase [Pontiellaceae bacterium]
MFEEAIQFIREQFHTTDFIPLHEPRFVGKEKDYLNDCIDSTFVSSVGAYVDRFEAMLAEYVGAKYAVVTVNGTAALHVALKLAGVQAGDEVITQPLTFIATANAVSYCGATPCFVDVDRETMGLSPDALLEFLETQTDADSKRGRRVNRQTGRPITVCVPMHTFGHPCRMDEIIEVCNKFGLPVIEDAAESLGSFYKGQHTGTFGMMSVFSFNGNKTITCGGGGAIVTNDAALARRAKHITTTAKVPHRWEFVHDEVGYNYRMPNLNAALACAQLEQIDEFLKNKRELAEVYKKYFSTIGVEFFSEPEHARSNYWLNAVILSDRKERDAFLHATNDAGVMTRPIWRLMNELEMFKDCPRGPLDHAEWLEERVVNIPSSVRLK